MDLFVRVKLGFLLVLIASFFNVSVGQSEEDEAGFYRFLTKVTHEFYDWTIATGRDPMRLNTTISFASDLLYVNASMKNHAVYAFPQMSPPISINSSLANGYVEVFANGSDVAVNGDYEISGFYNNSLDIPIEGSGRFNSIVGVSMSLMVFGFNNFTIVDDYIDMTGAIFSLEHAEIDHLGIEFHGLNAGGHELDVEILVGWEYSVLLNKSQEFKNAFLKMVKQYYSEIFANTPVSDMIRMP